MKMDYEITKDYVVINEKDDRRGTEYKYKYFLEDDIGELTINDEVEKLTIQEAKDKIIMIGHNHIAFESELKSLIRRSSAYDN